MINLAVLPAFALVESAATLLVVKSVMLAAAVPVLWSVAHTETDSRALAGAVTLMYVANPFLHRAWLFDYQEQAFLPLFVFAAYAAYQRRSPRLLAVLSLLICFVNEFAIVLYVPFLFGLAVERYRTGQRASVRRLFAPLLAGCLVYFAGTVVVLATFGAGTPFDWIGATDAGGGGRTSLAEALSSLLTAPRALAGALVRSLEAKLTALVGFAAPTLFFGLLDRTAVLPLLPYLLYAWVLADRSVFYEFALHYPLYLLPFLLIGTVRVVARLSLDRTAARKLLRVVLVVSVLGAAVTGAGALRTNKVPVDGPHEATVREALDTVPEDSTLLVQNNIHPNVATRSGSFVVLFEPGDRTYDYNVLQSSVAPPEYVVVDTAGPGRWHEPVVQYFGETIDRTYGVRFYHDGVWVFQRGYDGRASSAGRQTIDGPTTLFAGTYVASVTAEADRVAVVVNGTVATTADVDDGAAQVRFTIDRHQSVVVRPVGDGSVSRVELIRGEPAT